MLDKRIYLDGWYFRKNFGFVEIFQAYIRYRIRGAPLPDDGRIADLRAVCRWLAAETATDPAIVIDALSKAAIGHIGMASMDSGRRRGTEYNHNETVYEKNMQQTRFSAAVYLGHAHLATKFMQEGCCPTRDSHVFPSPMFLAAWAGRADMLCMLQEHLPEIEEVERYQSFDGRFLDFRAKTGPGSIEGAAASGSLDMVKLAMFPPSRADPDDFSFDPHRFGRLDTQPRLSACLSRSLSTGSLEIYRYISSFYKQEARMRHDLNPWTICKHSMFGHVDIVRHLLDLGAGRLIGEMDEECCLVQAASAGQVEIVDLLLERGADPDLIEAGQGPAVQAAADVGSLTILRRLLDRGASVDEERRCRLLSSAVRREHTAMVQLLLDRGFRETEFFWVVVEVALDGGLKSMMDLLLGPEETES